MSTTPETKSLRIPTPVDLQAIGYRSSHSQLLPSIFADMRDNGWRTPQQLRRVVDRSKKVVCEALCAAHKRGHVIKRPYRNEEHRWNLGETAYSIPNKKPELLAANELPSAADYWENGFTAAPGQLAERVIRTLNENGGELPGEALAKLVGVTWENLGYTLRPLETLGHVGRRRLHQVSALKKGNRRHAIRGHDTIVMIAEGVRSMRRATDASPTREIAESLRSILNRVDWQRVRCGPRVRRLIEVVAPKRLITWEDLAKEIGCDISGLYGSKKYPGPYPILRTLRILKTSRVGKRIEWTIDATRIVSHLPQIVGDVPSPLAEVKRKPRFGQLRRSWDRFDPELKDWAERFDHAKKGSVRQSERATAYLNLAAVIGFEFSGTYAELAERFGDDRPHEVTVGKYARMGAADGFFEIEPLIGPGGRAGIKLSVVRWRFQACAGERRADANGEAKAATTAIVDAIPVQKDGDAIEWSTYKSPGEWEKVFRGVTWKTIRRRIEAGKLVAECKHKQAWRFRLSDLPDAPKPR